MFKLNTQKLLDWLACVLVKDFVTTKYNFLLKTVTMGKSKRWFDIEWRHSCTTPFVTTINNSLSDHVVVEIGWNDSHGHGLTSLVDDLRDLLVFDAHNVLSVNLEMRK